VEEHHAARLGCQQHSPDQFGLTWPGVVVGVDYRMSVIGSPGAGGGPAEALLPPGRPLEFAPGSGYSSQN
jgi:hypothetical protein